MSDTPVNGSPARANDVETRPEEDRRPLETALCRGLLWVFPRERFVSFAAGRSTFGRDPTASDPLPGEMVSRIHASIVCSGPLLCLRDEGSRNGTRHNGVLVSEARLEDGDVIRLGEWVGVVTSLPFAAAQQQALFDEPLPGVLIGPRTRELWQRLCLLAKSPLPLLLQAPTGCGKEVFARAAHELSGRTGKFVAQNCAALTESLAEAQLFGHVRGAFTDARASAPGLFATADGGTLFLDEIVDLALVHQAKLLRAVEDGAVTALGATTPRPCDVRLVAAAQVPLSERVAAGLFREDLMARIGGAILSIPPMSERREEALRLFLRNFEAAGGARSLVDPSLAEAVVLYDWPLNVREIRNVAQRLALEYPGVALGAAHFEKVVDLRTPGNQGGSAPPPSVSPAVGSKRRQLWLERHRREVSALQNALTVHHGNLSEAARAVGISRHQAQRLLAASREADGDGN
ncbi:MAG TPA: sigma 54-interacting transcriptional regulator [Polyangiaceae bacterium]